MPISTSAFNISRLISSATLALVLLCFGGMTAASAQVAPDTENGRYSLSPVGDGVLRLDTRNGTVSTCNNTGGGWACYAVPDERKAFDEEIGRLQRENDKLRDQLAQREPTVTGKTEEALPKEDSLKKIEPKSAETERKLEVPLPSDRDLDRMMGFLERAWRRLVEMASRMQKDVSGKI